jgi:N-acetylglucosamine-6-phosphate deacetylase
VPLRIKGRIVGSEAPVEISVEGGRIASIEQVGPSTQVLGGEDCWIAPAFFDVQVNGFAGVDLNCPEITLEDVSHVIEKLSARGVLFFCPTIITQSFDHLSACLRSLCKATSDSSVRRAIPAFHLEGPYLSPEDGPRGTHPREHVREADWDEFRRLQDCAGGRIGMVTLAPEVGGALRLIERLADTGVVVALGHTAADPQTIRDAIRAGARTSTHLGNGSHLQMHRHSNYVWEQLAADELWASFIVDGHHLPPSVVKCMVRAKGWQRSILTSDAISAAGMPPGRYRCGEIEIVVRPDYKAERADSIGSGILAGSALDLLRGVENLLRFTQLGLFEAVCAASSNPAKLFNLSNPPQEIAVGSEADLVVFRHNPVSQALDLRYTIQQGRIVHQA